MEKEKDNKELLEKDEGISEVVEPVFVKLGDFNLENILYITKGKTEEDRTYERLSPKDGLAIVKDNLVIAWVRFGTTTCFVETAGDRLQTCVSKEDYEDFVDIVKMAFKIVNRHNQTEENSKVEVN